MQQSLSDLPKPDEYMARRGQRPGLMKRAQFAFMLALFVLDVGSIWLAFWAGHWILTQLPDIVIGPFLEFWQLPATYTLVLVTIYFSQRMYQRRRPVTHLDEFFRIVVNNVLATLFTVALLTLFLREFQYHRLLVLLGAGFTMLFDTLARVIHAQLQWQAQARGLGDDRVLLIGAGEIGQMLLHKILLQPKLGYQIVGVIDAGKSPRSSLPGQAPVLGSLADVPWVIDRYGVDEVIIGLPESSNQELVNIISLCEREKVGIRVFPDVFQFMASEVTIGDLGGLPLLTIRDVALQGWKLTVKRLMDMLLSAVGLVFLSPFMLLAALLVKLDSPGPVFYTQERMGLDAIPFKIIKFRTMRIDAEEEGPGWTTPDDPRKTKLGAFLRRFNIDELPQLINVLVGDMSLVGPRPERPVYVEQFRQIIPRYMDRHREKAGLTGWAQINGLRGDTSIGERTKYDLWYIENWSIGLDLKIIIRTILQTLFGTNQNAY
jgi:exopolysaccharide biosynthesis polyprenyl glycosylphosphotransferase